MNQFTSNFTVHNKKTRQNMNLHLPYSKLTLYQKGTYYMAIRIYNSLPTQTKETAYDPKQFRKNLKSFLYLNSFYTLQEYFNHDK
jgi:glucan biosynthesis protein